MDIRIREFRPEDKERYCALNFDFFNEVVESNQYWTSLLDRSMQDFEIACDAMMQNGAFIKVFLAFINDTIVGFANVQIMYSLWSRGFALNIDDLYVHPEYRQCGIGEKLMLHIEDYAHANDYTRIQLHAELDNEKAISLYRKMAYKQETLYFFMKNDKRRDYTGQ